MRRPQGRRGVGLAILIGGGLSGLLLVQHLRYRDWHPIVSPLEPHPLVIRADAKGQGHFGAPRSGHRLHRGIDLEAPLGAPVQAIRSGTVIEAARHRGLGLYVELAHRDGLRSVYAHLDTIAVDAGDRVRQGQRIGTVGKTGNARHPRITPHLHLEVSRHGEPIDPTTLGLTVREAWAANDTPDVDADGGN